MTDYLDTGVAAHALDLQIIDQSIRGYAVAAGVEPSKGTNPLETEVTAGTTLVNGTAIDFDATADQAVTHDAGGTDPRRDVAYIGNVNGDAVLQVAKGTPAAAEHAQGDGGVAFADVPFEFASPSPPSMNDFDGTPVAEIAVPAGATDYSEPDHLRSLRATVDLYTNQTSSLTELHLPEYDNVNNAPPIEPNIIHVSGDGADSEGVYIYNGSNYVKLGEDITLDDLVIDADRNWNGFAITDVSEFDVSDRFFVEGGRGSFSLPDQHTRYPASLTNTEVARWSLPSNEVMEVTLLEVTQKGGGTDPDFTVTLQDEDSSTTLAQTSTSVRGSPVATSDAGSDVSLLVTNGTGSSVDATISGQLFRSLQ